MGSKSLEILPPVPRGDRIAAAVMTALLLLVAIAAAVYGLLIVVSAAAEILVSVIAGSASLLSAVFAYVFQRAKDLELSAEQKRTEIELRQRQLKKENYARILECLAPYVRDPKAELDNFTTAYLHSWITGSAKVVKQAHGFLEDRHFSSLDALLRAMREDLSIEGTDSKEILRGLTSQKLFPEPPPLRAQQGLRTDSTPNQAAAPGGSAAGERQ